MEILKNTALAPYTSWQIGGPAEFFCAPTDEAELKAAVIEAKKNSWALTILGGGSNVLIGDHGVDGLVICLKNLTGLQTEILNGRLHIEVLAGTPKSELLKTFLKHKIAPALFMAGLPGDVGGGVVMNAGVSENMQPREFGELVDWIEILRLDSFKLERIKAEQIKWSYRHSEGWQPGVILRAGLSWPMDTDAEIIAKVKAANLVRLSRQPLDKPSCGSVFVNPPNHKAAQLIEGCGLKGLQRGGAQVSLKHSNFIVNLGGATAGDVRGLIQEVQERVRKEKNVELKTEVVFIGSFR